MFGSVLGANLDDPTLVVVRTKRSVPRGQQLQFGPSRYEPLACLEHVADVSAVGRNGGHPDQRPAV